MRNCPSVASISLSIATAGALLATATACSSGTPNSSQASSEPQSTVTSSSPSGSSTPTTQRTSPEASAAPSVPPAPAPTTRSAAEQQLAALSLEQRVGQLFMVAAKATGAEPATLQALTKYHAGNVYLSGRSKAGTGPTAGVVSSLTSTVSADTTGGVPLFVATDQEGGYVQVLSGQGFSTIPTALVQASSGAAKLRTDAAAWGKELRSVGVNVNLAPVLDTVTSPEFAPSNAPIGHFQREYGYDPGTVSLLGNAFADGMKDAGVAPVVKHFPGLGRVVPNTDVSKDVRDTTTTRDDPALKPFQAAITSGAQWVMVSNAYYDKIDPANIAPFSPMVMDTMLRSDAGFKGIVLSDDLCSAAQLEAWSDADRALNFFGAGGTMLVCANPASIPAMHQAVVQKAVADPAFRAKVDAAALTVLRVKAGQ
ncbi:glycoside hydrolase family 3 N-terminal domain-containing protein [Paenarthrobacter aurescens]|uniref:glycoside hydrolase family 3 N-terminal domain-containing protein n=1 Tax=Paenarthrobacter aurescens TaxID=43663 RepID=UPI0011426ECE|nr:glycoside hydrolase family 3 N-terminal domain-containing protein [Paenarthrobacter aurescens]MDO6144164.1 glycoside hydrolase family 3 protein [Paenarthrobacter aurescens]MDO6148011.1 glycoside hydrolase family 3 protein [Paenarthrobacter aurescens]MDO6159255.1 glycoside hydrolase family 3 protein [Paenarthrobacter aurescens]MDO6163238.1 glycoside hydrolase family 3 protein [Paenarthrobacter aurescens]